METDNPIIRITEIFHSIQGEGFHAGTSAVFIRGTGCNLACDFCDTDFSPREKLSPQAVLERIAPFPCRFVVLTGGEPTIQARGFRALVDLLHANGYYVTMETNGSSADTLGVDWVTVSPKLSQNGKWVLKHADELKLVYESQDLEFYERGSGFRHYFLQPKEIRTAPWGGGERDVPGTRAEWEKTAQAVLANPRWKLSIQLHKELGLR
ncbi:MAG: radical protein [Fibrobacteres bacterium]|nr:radical protein [Fibrobacterota bacterium]